MATSIATGALRPKVAVILAGALNLVGAFLSVEVAKTISSGLVDDTLITEQKSELKATRLNSIEGT